MHPFGRLMLLLADISGWSIHLVNILPSNEDAQIREAVDRIRVLLAELQLEAGGMNDLFNDIAKYPTLVRQASQFLQIYRTAEPHIHAWIAQGREIPIPTSASEPAEIERWLDAHIPLQWCFDSDILIIEGSIFSWVAHHLEARGQQRVVVVDEDAHESPTHSKYQFVSSPDDMGRYITRLWGLVPERLTMWFRPGFDLSSYETEARDALIVAQSARQTSTFWGEDWAIHAAANLRRRALQPSLEQMRAFVAGRPAVVVSPGPSLARNVHVLKERRDEVLIMAVGQACVPLLKHGITPDIATFVDGGDHVGLFEGLDASKIPYFFALDAVHPSIMALPFQQVFSLPVLGYEMFQKPDDVNLEIEIFTAPTVSLVTVRLARFLGCPQITLTGQDLSFSKKVYLDRVDNQSVHINEQTGKIQIGDDVTQGYKLPGYYGGEVWTRSDYYTFHRNFSEYGRHIDDGSLFNSTEGGALIPGFSNIPLSEFIDSYPAKKTAFTPKSDATPLNDPQRVNAWLDALTADMDDLAEAARALRSTISRKAVFRDEGMLQQQLQVLMQLSAKHPVINVACQREMQRIQRVTVNPKTAQELDTLLGDVAHAIHERAVSIAKALRA